ncbi:hypothetical protein IMZ48_48090 [Candidatus Bathyarchaeota archaeon]|nr:hypothetical protein [Candidatus Bathyarchaeota archaeon]
MVVDIDTSVLGIGERNGITVSPAPQTRTSIPGPANTRSPLAVSSPA